LSAGRRDRPRDELIDSELRLLLSLSLFIYHFRAEIYLERGKRRFEGELKGLNVV
jgi:hypothetical protein